MRALTLQASGQHQSLSRLPLQRLSRMPQHMLARCTYKQSSEWNRHLALLPTIPLGPTPLHVNRLGAGQHEVSSHLERFSSRSSLTSLGSCTDTGMMLPGKSGRLGNGTASTCIVSRTH